MGNTLELLYDLITKPKEALQQIHQTGSLRRAAEIVVLSTMCSSLIACSQVGIGGGKSLLLLMQIIGTLLVWAIAAAIWHIIAEMLGGQGKVKRLLTTTGFIYFLQILVVPFYLISAILPAGGFFLIMLSGFIIFVWTCVLNIFAIAEVYQLSGGKAVLIYLMPWIVFIMITIVLMFAIGGVIMSTAGEIMNEELLINPPMF